MTLSVITRYDVVLGIVISIIFKLISATVLDKSFVYFMLSIN